MMREWRRGHGCGGGFARGIRSIAEGVGRDTDRRFARGLAHPPEAALSLAVPGLMCGQGSLSAIYPFGGPLAAAADGKGVRAASSPARPPRPGHAQLHCGAPRSWHRLPFARLGRAMLSFTVALPTVALPELRGAGLTAASVDAGPCVGGWEDGWQLRLRHMFSREGALALDRMRICGHPEDPRAAQEWMEQVSGSVFVPERGRGCGY